MSRDATRRYARRLKFESLECRRVLATFTVTSLNDTVVIAPGNAPGTLRQAIYDADQAPGEDTIEFAANLSGSVNLSVADDTANGASALVISSPITIIGNSNGITIARSSVGPEMRLFRVTADGSLTLERLSLTGGIARGADATSPDEDGGLGLGGEIYSQGPLQLIASTLHGNQAIGGNGGQQSGISGTGRGGAIYSDNSSLVITNSTISGNSSQSGTGHEIVNSFGGATYSKNGSTTIHNSTVSNNVSASGRGVYVFVDAPTTVDIHSSILGQSDTSIPKRDLLVVPATENEQITVTGSNNLIRSQSDYSYITVSTDDPKLGTLAYNGGPTMTHALAADSPAVNLGSNSQNLTADQRGSGYSRDIGGAADIGAFELQTVAVPPLPTDYNRNSVVDAADYVVWRNSLDSDVVAYTGGDGTGDGAVDANDFAAWRATFGTTAPGAAAGRAMREVPGQNPSLQLSLHSPAFTNVPTSVRTNNSNYVQQGILALAIAHDVTTNGEPLLPGPISATSHGESDDSDAAALDAVFAVWPSA